MRQKRLPRISADANAIKAKPSSKQYPQLPKLPDPPASTHKTPRSVIDEVQLTHVHAALQPVFVNSPASQNGLPQSQQDAHSVETMSANETSPDAASTGAVVGVAESNEAVTQEQRSHYNATPTSTTIKSTPTSSMLPSLGSVLREYSWNVF